MSGQKLAGSLLQNPALTRVGFSSSPLTFQTIRVGQVLDADFSPTNALLTAQSGRPPIGLALSAGIAGQSVPVLNSGPLTLTKQQWGAVNVNVGAALTPGAVYFLELGEPDAPNAVGRISVFDEITFFVGPQDGRSLVKIGSAISEETLIVDIDIWASGDDITTQGYNYQTNNSDETTIPVGNLRSCAIASPLNFALGTLVFARAPSVTSVVPPGTPTYLNLSQDGTVYDVAAANALGTSGVVAVLAAAGARLLNEEPAAASVIYAGPLVLTTDQWDAVIEGGGSGGLVAPNKYYLSATPGKITSVAPLSPNYVVKVGHALNAQTLIVQIGEPVVGSSQ